MARAEHLTILNRGVEAWNAWRSQFPDIRPDLERASLAGADLSGANLANANLFGIFAPGVSLRGARLKQSDARMATLQGADLMKADVYRAAFCGSLLDGACLQSAHCNGADFSGAHLANVSFAFASTWGVNFERALLYGSDFGAATMGDCSFANTDIGDVRNLDKAILEYACVIDHRTLLKSKSIPSVFLKACGLTATFVRELPALLDDPATVASCFISHSSQDDEFARRLYLQLQSLGVRCWFAPEDLKIGAELRPTFDREIQAHDRLLLVLSKASVTSRWVEAEVEKALEIERREGRAVLFPVRLDDSVFEFDGWAALVKNTRHIGDFRKWREPDEYSRAFERLVNDLKT